jgi:hypothetical protein
MTLETLYYITQIIAVLAILGSLIAIWFQMRQNQMVERADSQREVLAKGQQWIKTVRDDPDLYDVAARLMEDYATADPADQGRFWAWGFELLLTVEMAMYMHKDGFMNQASYDGFMQVGMSLIKTQGGHQWWQEVQHIWGADAVEELKKRMDEIGDQVPPWNELRPDFKRYMDQKRRQAADAS